MRTSPTAILSLFVATAFCLPTVVNGQTILPNHPFGAYQRLMQERMQSASRGAAPLSDRAFDVYVSPQLIGRAYISSDSALLTDVALQLAEGERVLLRSRSGLTAAQASQLAIKAASDKQDKASLERLSRHAERQGDKDLASRIATAKKLTALSRDTTWRMMIPIEEVEIDDVQRIRYCVQKIDQAKLTSDSRCLKALEDDVKGCIPDRFQESLQKMIAEARATMPEKEEINEDLVTFLSRLAASSRPDDDDSGETSDQPAMVSGAF